MWLELVFEVNEPENIRRPVQAPLKPSITEHSILDSHMINLFCYTLDNVACIGFAAIKPVSDTPLFLSLSLSHTQYPHNEINDWDKTDILVLSGCFQVNCFLSSCG